MATGVVAVFVGIAKFALGAWVVLLLMPILMGLMWAISRHYQAVSAALALEDRDEAQASLPDREPRVIGSIVDVMFAPDDPAAVVDRLAAEGTRIVSTTITEGGYLVNQVTEWVGYDTASAAAKAHWDVVLKNLKKHEKRHMDIAIEVGNDLAKLLVGHEIGSKPSIADKTTAANTRMQKLQDDMDSANESDHGRKKGHAYGDCNIDTSIT